MRFAAVAVAALSMFGFAAAQTTSAAAAKPSSGACQAQNIVDACLKTIQGQIDSCKANDWICLCQQYTNLLTCYNNCPDSASRPPVQNQVTQYCAAAAPLLSSSAAAAATAPRASSASGAQATTLAASGTGAAASGTASKTATGAAASKTGAAGAIAAPVGGVFAVLFGVAGLL
ncbi:uncharacterized protein BDR25DRAFT_305804 [Lindgomyces ingoldianus]|uniref:Uncharacterized protein n=1 Tax=Lindgomyces ingoldianus TaxID=673940 RepID=A0ACB6QKY6_9PLEO|nr:uncharacterized protein BDR25DRAFT_305804 [Lindgomyces ingoldianus]KAF2466977.1 hypothetical protein BDR25DRAFT_305804 [Lindgomyces ingoldianus]